MRLANTLILILVFGLSDCSSDILDAQYLHHYAINPLNFSCSSFLGMSLSDVVNSQLDTLAEIEGGKFIVNSSHSRAIRFNQKKRDCITTIKPDEIQT